MIGTDIVSVRRVKDSIHRFGESFLKRLFTDLEIHYCNSKKYPEQHFAARFAAKEAAIKALNLVGQGISFTQIEITNNSNGAPILSIKIPNHKFESAWVSLSHEKDYAVATVLVKK